MSFSLKYKTLRNGNTYYLQTRPEMSAHEELSTTASELNEAEQNNETSTGLSPGFIDERIKANLEHLHA